MSSPITLLSSIVEHRQTRPGGYDVVQFDPAGEPHARAVLEAVLGHYYRITDRPRPTLPVLRGLTGARVTIAYTASGAFGGKFVEAREGTLVPPSDYLSDVQPDDTRLALRPSGARSRAVVFDAAAVLDVERVYGHLDELRGLVALCQNRLPRLQALGRDDLLALPGNELDTSDTVESEELGDAEPTWIRLAVMGTWRGPDGDVPAAIWLLHSYDPDADIAEGYLLVDPAYGYSEHGSIYGRHLLRLGGRIDLPRAANGAITMPGGQPLTLTDCFALGDLPQEQWLTYFTR